MRIQVSVAFSIILFCITLFSTTYRYDVKMMGIPVGSTSESWTTETKNGVCTITMHSRSTLNIARGTASISMQTETKTVAHCKTFFPISIHSSAKEGGTATHIDATVTGNTLNGTISRNGVSETHSIKLPKNAILFSHLFKAFPEKEFLAGKKNIPVVNDETLSMISLTPLAKKTAQGLEITVMFSGVPIVSTLKNGIIQTSSLQGGIITYTLQGGTLKPPAVTKQATDMLSSSALINRGKTINRPRNTKEVTFVIRGKNIPEIPASCSQEIIKMDGENIKIISKSHAKCRGSASLADITGNIYEDINNPLIQKTAKKLFSTSHSNAEFIQKTISYVFDRISDKSYKHGSLSASEALKKRSGDCTEHSTLLSALLKSQGVPVKMLYGIVLTKDNRFFFHNWNAVFNGNTWTPVDATMNLIPTDASRIIISMGGNSAGSREQVAISVINFLNKLSISVVEAH
ncbi:transglutaminase domain-containing protein [bacterium]|nr:transglutaminase domain-containing protein [bacterium]